MFSHTWNLFRYWWLRFIFRTKSFKRSFSKLKLIKSYLRSTMSQKRLSRLTILSIEKEMLAKLESKILISNFASQKARKINFNWKNIYKFIIKYNKMPHLKLLPKAPKFIKPALFGTLFRDVILIITISKKQKWKLWLHFPFFLECVLCVH